MGNFWRSCAKLRELIELSFGMVNGVGQMMGVLDGVHVPQEEGEALRFFFPIGLNGVSACF